ncbi:MAG TPA: hypothetical protein VLG38_04080 [Gammaproteobacteria bacterium]|nr:hypothetical protein [Gammaproteobacteria bacterium]
MSLASPNNQDGIFDHTPTPPALSLDGTTGVGDNNLPFAQIPDVNVTRTEQTQTPIQTPIQTPTPTPTPSDASDEEPRSWTQLILSSPYALFRELTGMVAGWGFLTVAGLAAWNLGRQYYLDKVIQPAATLLISATFPAAIVPSELLLYAITNPDLLSMAFTTLVMANKSVAGKAFKDGRDGFKDWAREYFKFGKKAPKNVHSLSWKNVRHQILDKVTDVLAIAPGFASAAFMVVSVRAVSLALFKALKGMPIISTPANIIADVYGALLFVATVVVGKEAPEMLQKWGHGFGTGLVDDAYDATAALATRGFTAVTDAAAEASNSVYQAGAAIGNSMYNAGATVGNGVYDAGAYVANTMSTLVGFAASTTPTNAQYQAARTEQTPTTGVNNPALTTRLINAVI